jgi:general secretion pathway protein B
VSILLEALRKSEKSQRAHEVPTIHADGEAATVPESLATGPLAMLLVLALFTSGWFVWHQYQAPASSVQPTVADTQQPAVGSQSAVADTPTPVVATQDAVANTQPATARPQPSVSDVKDESPIVTPPLTSDARAAQVTSSKTVADQSTGQQRTPMESYKAPARSAPKTKPTGTQPEAVTPSPTETAATPAEPRHEVPRPIGYWELPDSVRANVSEIKFSVLVYATNPSDRFVLINGQRLLEGDVAGPDLVVKEIRRDGVIFSYRLYQFLVER